MKRAGCLAVLLILALPPGLALAQAQHPKGNILTGAQAEHLYNAVCSEPAVKESSTDGTSSWYCPLARNYPNKQFNGCAVSFDADKEGRFSLFYGRFSGHGLQAFAAYASCEPNSNNGGGGALFDIVDGKFKLLRYYPGERYGQCVVPPSPPGHRQALYCLATGIQTGREYASFWRMTFASNHALTTEEWYWAYNDEGLGGGPNVDCRTPYMLHDVESLDLLGDGKTIVLTGNIYDPRRVAEACRRFRAPGSDAGEQSLRREFPHLHGLALLQDDESDLFKAEVRFQLPDRTPYVHIHR